MPRDQAFDVNQLVEPDRVHKDCYTSQEIFEAELQNIFYKAWIYVGHESQIPNPGDYWTTQIGKQRMIMSRAADGQVHVLYNRCPHRGALLCPERNGNAGKGFRCTYHAWQFHMDGSVRQIPMKQGYDGTNFSMTDPQFAMKKAERYDSYRGFVFASLSEEGPDLETWLGGAKIAFDDMCNRAPQGKVQVVPTCFRVIQKGNWKIFLENQLDALHPSITHESTGVAAKAEEDKYEAVTGEKPPLSYHMLSAFVLPFEAWDSLNTVGHPHGHCTLEGYMGLRPQDPDTLAYEAVMKEAYGEEKMEEIFSVNVHHALVYPCLSVQSPLQQLRAVRPLAPDRTLTEIWHFRLLGAPEAIYRRSLAYYYHVNSPSTMVNADDLHNFWACEEGLKLNGGDWVSFHRNAGQDTFENETSTSVTGMSEHPMRHMFKQWSTYMAGNN